jgi:hypothetical protein
MIGRKKILLLPVLTILLMFGCNYFRSDVNKYVVNIKFSGGVNGEKPESVSAIVGADKFWWTSLEAGEEKTVNLFSDKNAVNNLTLLYTLGGKQKNWESANFAENSDYQINITIDSEGSVTENSCRMPCR